MYSTHQKGLYGELSFTLHLIRKGYTILHPVNPNSSYDLVIEEDGIFQRIQVKYLTARHGVLRVELKRPQKNVPYKNRGVDAIGVFESTQEKYYLIPIKKIPNVSDFWLRLDSPKNKQKKGIHLAKRFEI